MRFGILWLSLCWSSVLWAQTCSDAWDIVNPKINLGAFSAVTYGNGQFVAVGAGGRTAHSSDAVQWTASRTGKGSTLNGVAWGNGRYVAVAEDATVFTSTDGATWTESLASQGKRRFSRILSNGNSFVLIGAESSGQALLASSADGVTWNFQTPTLPRGETKFELNDITWSGTEFIAAGIAQRADRTVALLLVSTDGQNWEGRYIEDSDGLYFVAANATRWLVDGGYDWHWDQQWSSTDGKNWQRTTTLPLERLHWNGSRFLASEGNNAKRIITSEDLTNWSPVYELGGVTRDFTTGGGKTVAVGGRVIGAGGWSQGEIYTSTDAGLNWQSPLSVTAGDLHDLIWTGQGYQAVGFAGNSAPPALRSSDGVNWTQSTDGLAQERGVLRTVAWGNGRAVAAGDNGFAFLSTDGVRWQRIHDKQVERSERFYQDALWDGQQFVLAGTEYPWDASSKVVLLSSPTGETWTAINTRVSGYVVKLMKTDQRWIGVGGYIDTDAGYRPKAMVITSEDGKAWTFRPLDLDGTLYGVAGNGTQLVAVGSKHCWWSFCGGESGMSIVTSKDGGNSWQPQNPGIASVSYQILNKVAWSGSEFVAVGDKGLILSSSDGANWQLRHSNTGQALLGLDWDGSRFITSGMNGAILRSRCTDQAAANGHQITDALWIRALIQTEEKGAIEARWQKGGEDTTARGDRVIWGHFYADPADVEWGSINNPDLFVKIWFDKNGRIDVNYFHVSVPDIHVYTAYQSNPQNPQEYGTATVNKRYVRHFFENGIHGSQEIRTDSSNPPVVSGSEGKPKGADIINRLRIGSRIYTESAGVIEGQWRLGGSSKTSRGDEVAWGLFHANPTDVNWGSSNNPDVFVKVWFDFAGRIDVNYFHVSVPSIALYSDYPSDSTYDSANTTGLSYRYIRHEFQQQ